MNSKIVKNNINNNHSAQPSDWRGSQYYDYEGDDSVPDDVG